jgi:hypothetical protein
MSFEFHFAENSARQRIELLRTVTAFRFNYHAFGLDKQSANPADVAGKHGLYKWTAQSVIEFARPHLREATLVIDKRGEHEFRNELAGHLRRLVTPADTRMIRKVKVQPSHDNNLLQIADYVAGISSLSMTGKEAGLELRRRYLSAHERTF